MKSTNIKKFVACIAVIGITPFISFAQTQASLCSKTGYTIETINGIFTKETDPNGDGSARENRDSLKRHMDNITSFNGEPLTFDYLYNPTHGPLGVTDLTDVVIQKTFEGVDMEDPDFLKILDDANTQIKTQKILLVAHSQGNFYANNLYNTVTNDGDVAPESIGVYGIATPAREVAGGGLYLTSDTDTVINKVRKLLPGSVLPAHDSIDYLDSDDSGRGHGFREVYLKYKSEEIKKEIELSLSKLLNAPDRSENVPCIQAPQKVAIYKNLLNTVDYSAKLAMSLVETYPKMKESVISDIRGLAINTSFDAALGVYRIVSLVHDAAVSVSDSLSLSVNYIASTINSAVNTFLSGDQLSVNNNMASVIGAIQPSLVVPEQTEAFPGAQQVSISSDVENPPIVQEENLGTPVSASAPTVSLEAPTVEVPIATTTEIVDTGTHSPVVAMALTSDVKEVASYSSSIPDGGGALREAPIQEQGAAETEAPVEEISKTPEPQNADTPALAEDASTTPEQTDADTTVPAEDTSVVQEPQSVDITSPVISIIGDNPATITVGDTYVDEGATAVDDTDGIVDVTATSSVNTLIAGTYEVTYVSADSSANTATSTRAVNVVAADPTPALTRGYFSDLNGNGVPDENENEVVVTTDQKLLSGQYYFHNLTITNNATLTLGGDTATSTESGFLGVKIIADNLTVTNGSKISSDGKGYLVGGLSPGVPSEAEYLNGGNYGGIGVVDMGSAHSYGSALHPLDMGSPGRAGIQGGGAIWLVVNDSLVNDGTISSNGSAASSGGSVYVSTNNLAGAGSFSSNGGGRYVTASYIAPGAGGRVAIYYQNSTFTGATESLAGCQRIVDWLDSYTCKDPGTVALVDTAKNELHVVSSFRFLSSDGPFNFDRIIIESGATVTMDDGVTLNTNELVVRGQLNVSKGSNLVASKVVVDTGTILLSGEETLNAETLDVFGGGTVTVIPERVLSLDIADITIESGSSISADMKGYKYRSGPGAPQGDSLMGASYGGRGYGGDQAGPTYGSSTEPVDFGSGGGGTSPMGGGAIRIVSTGTILNNGTISANGDNTSSGGSVYITANNISGQGSINANGGGMGGSGYYAWPGGGGRIAIYYKNSTFSGAVASLGGTGHYETYSASGEDGTVVMEQIVEAPTEPVVSDIPAEPVVPDVSTEPIGSDTPTEPVAPPIPTTPILPPDYQAPLPSSEKFITSFDILLATSTNTGVVDNNTHTIGIIVPVGTELNSIAPDITVSPLATVSPASNIKEDFTSPVTYTVTAEDGTTQEYIVTVTAAPDTVAPAIKSFVVNNQESPSITGIDFVMQPTLELALNATENVDWVSVVIEYQDDTTKHKIFFSGAGCVDGTAVCAKSWDGILSDGSKAPLGKYRIKLNMRDMSGNQYQGYLPSAEVYVMPAPGVI